MIHPHNNDFGLPSIEVQTKEPFEIGNTRMGRAADKNWLVHLLNESTLAIAPENEPNKWNPAHIYGRGRSEGEMWGFTLTPSERETAKWETLEKVAKVDVDSLVEAIDEAEEQVGLLVADNLDCAPFDGLGAKLSQARELIIEAIAEAAAFISANGPPSTDEPCKLTPRGRR
jgi:hypothetical protein